MGKANKKEQNDFNKLIINEKEEKNIKLSKVRKFLGIDKQKEEKLKIDSFENYKIINPYYKHIIIWVKITFILCFDYFLDVINMTDIILSAPS